jgi:hypothetical protein
MEVGGQICPSIPRYYHYSIISSTMVQYDCQWISINSFGVTIKIPTGKSSCCPYHHTLLHPGFPWRSVLANLKTRGILMTKSEDKTNYIYVFYDKYNPTFLKVGESDNVSKRFHGETRSMRLFNKLTPLSMSP